MPHCLFLPAWVIKLWHCVLLLITSHKLTSAPWIKWITKIPTPLPYLCPWFAATPSYCALNRQFVTMRNASLYLMGGSSWLLLAFSLCVHASFKDFLGVHTQRGICFICKVTPCPQIGFPLKCDPPCSESRKKSRQSSGDSCTLDECILATWITPVTPLYESPALRPPQQSLNQFLIHFTSFTIFSLIWTQMHKRIKVSLSLSLSLHSFSFSVSQKDFCRQRISLCMHSVEYWPETRIKQMIHTCIMYMIYIMHT